MRLTEADGKIIRHVEHAVMSSDGPISAEIAEHAAAIVRIGGDARRAQEAAARGSKAPSRPSPGPWRPDPSVLRAASDAMPEMMERARRAAAGSTRKPKRVIVAGQRDGKPVPGSVRVHQTKGP